MNKRLLTLDDLYKFYSTKKKSMKFNADKNGEPIVVQVDGKMSFSKSEDTEGLTAVHLQACHTEKNLNSSSISFETMEQKLLPSFKNRPILGYIHEVDGKPEFYGHNMHVNPDTDEIVYEEIAVGIIPETNNAKLEYDSENDRYNVIIDGYIFNEYTKASEILEREQECYVSVEISIREMAYSVKEKCLEIQDGYFSGVTILGKDENGNKIIPGMAGSNIKLKDFSESNNSMFSDMTEDEHTKLVDTLEKLNKTLENISKFNIDETNTQEDNMKGGVSVKKDFEDNENNTLVTETESTEVVETEKCKPKKKNEAEDPETFDDTDSGDTSDDDTNTTEEGADGCSDTGDGTDGGETGEGGEEPTDLEARDGEGEENPGEEPEDKEDPDDDSDDSDDDDDDDDKKREPFSKTFELSHDDIRGGLYELLRPYEEVDNDWYWIMEVFDNHFIYQGMTGVMYGQKYTVDKENETVAFDGERYEVYVEYLTASEKAELENMRSNYSSIQAELNTYKEAELNSQREAVFNDEAYADFVDTAEFKEIKEKINTYSVDELRTACDLAFAKNVKAKGTFALNKNTNKKDEKKTANFFAFSRQEQNTSFLDGLLKK